MRSKLKPIARLMRQVGLEEPWEQDDWWVVLGMFLALLAALLTLLWLCGCSVKQETYPVDPPLGTCISTEVPAILVLLSNGQSHTECNLRSNVRQVNTTSPAQAGLVQGLTSPVATFIANHLTVPVVPAP